MFKRILSVLLVCAVIFGFGIPNAKVYASNHQKAKNYSYDGVEVPDQFKRQQMKDMELTIPTTMDGILSENEEGLVFSGKKKKLTAGRITIDKDFDFGSDYVGRFSFEATRTAGKPISIIFYIDNSVEPLAEFEIGREGRIDPVTEKEKWEQSAVVMDKAVTSGTHKLAFSFVTDSAEASVTFKSFEFVKNSLPVVSFDIDEKEGTVDEMNTSERHTAECHGKMNISVPNGYVGEYSDNVQSGSYDMEYIRGRGNSTWSADKKPYKIKLDKKSDLFGMGANKHWVLLANIYDNSKMRNKMTYELGERLNMPYTPKSVPVDVVMNGEYYGNYYLSEQVRLGENRVDLPDLTETKTELTDDEITGGYLLSAEQGEDENCFNSNRNSSFTIESPAAEDWQNTETSFDEVKGYIQGYVNKCEEAMYNEDYKAEDGTPYTDLIDVDSMIKYYLFQEFSQNGDAYENGSTYFYKDRNGKLCFGPLWDFDYVAWAGCDYEEEPLYQFQQQYAVWNARMLQNDSCFESLKAYYAQMKAELNDMIADDGYIDTLYNCLRDSMYYDIERNGFYEHRGEEDEPYTYSFEKERQRLKDWISGKMAYVDENIDDIQPTPYTITFTVDDQVVSEQKVLKGDSVELPADPEKPGYTFLGWYYKDYEGTEDEFNPDMDFDKDMTIYAKFTSPKEEVKETDVIVRTDDVYVPISASAYSISYQVTPSNATFQDCEVTSSNPNVADVEDVYSGTFVNLKEVGDTTITLTSHNGIKKSFVLHVVPTDYPVELEDVEFEDGPIKLKVGESKLIDYKLVPTNAPYTMDIEFIIGSLDIADMSDSGIITGNTVGRTFVLAQYNDSRKFIEVIVEDDTPTPPTPPTPTVKKDALTLYGEFLKADKSAKYYSVIMPTNGSKPLLVVTNSVAKKKYAKAAAVYTVQNNKVVKVGNIKGKKGYLKEKSGSIVAKFSKKSVAYYKVKGVSFTGTKYTKAKKKYYRYKLNGTKFTKKKKISKKKGKKYLKAKGAKSIVFTAK